MPPIRLEIIDDLAQHPGSTATEVHHRLNKPRTTVDRQLQGLQMLGVLDGIEEETRELFGRLTTRSRYLLAKHIDPSALDPSHTPDLLVNGHKDTVKEDVDDLLHTPTNISGER